MKREDVYKLIDGERDYQEIRWSLSTQKGPHIHTPEEWIIYMEDYINEAKHLLSRNAIPDCYPQAMEILRKVTAMGICAMEQNETKPRIV